MNQAVQPAKMRRPTESGVPDNKPYLHPLLAKNYGQWKYHDRPRPGVLHHVAKNGDEVWSVRAGTQRQMDVYTVRKLCDIADQFAEGRVRFTIRSNIEFMVSSADKVNPLIAELEKNGFPVGGTGNSVSMIAHTQGWLHCDIPGTDASGVVKADVETIKTNPVVNAGTVTFPTGATLASTTNITAAAGCAVSSIGANVVNAAALATDAVT